MIGPICGWSWRTRVGWGSRGRAFSLVPSSSKPKTSKLPRPPNPPFPGFDVRSRDRFVPGPFCMGRWRGKTGPIGRMGRMGRAYKTDGYSKIESPGLRPEADAIDSTRQEPINPAHVEKSGNGGLGTGKFRRLSASTRLAPARTPRPSTPTHPGTLPLQPTRQQPQAATAQVEIFRAPKPSKVTRASSSCPEEAMIELYRESRRARPGWSGYLRCAALAKQTRMEPLQSIIRTERHAGQINL